MTGAKQVEAVARAIFKTGYVLGPLWVMGNPSWKDLPEGRRGREDMRRLARAAIKAMPPRSKKP